MAAWVQLREARNLRQLSQEELARRSGLQLSAISHFENGTRKPSFDNLRRLADALEVSMDNLFGRSTASPGVPPTALHQKLGGLSATDSELVERLVNRLSKW